LVAFSLKVRKSVFVHATGWRHTSGSRQDGAEATTACECAKRRGRGSHHGPRTSIIREKRHQNHGLRLAHVLHQSIII
jgi:hypothetical protein